MPVKPGSYVNFDLQKMGNCFFGCPFYQCIDGNPRFVGRVPQTCNALGCRACWMIPLSFFDDTARKPE